MNPEIDREIDEPAESELCVPISHLSLEPGINEPLEGWGPLFESLSIKVTTDYAGRAAVSSLAVRRLFHYLRRRDELFAEDRERRTRELAAKYPLPAGGLPALDESATAWESLMAGGVVTPEQEFGGRPRPNFLREELAAGEQAQAEKRRLASERAKQRLADQAKDKLR